MVDLGCGIGLDAQRIAACGAKVIAIDFDENFIKKAKLINDNSKIKFYNSSIYELPIESNTISKITIDRVFQHLENHDAAFNEINRVLVKNGKIQITDTDYLSMTFFTEFIQLEKKLINFIATEKIPNAWKLRILFNNIESYGYKVINRISHDYSFNSIEIANSIVRFNKIFNDGYKTGYFIDEELLEWEKIKSNFKFSMNLLTIDAIKI